MWRLSHIQNFKPWWDAARVSKLRAVLLRAVLPLPLRGGSCSCRHMGSRMGWRRKEYRSLWGMGCRLVLGCRRVLGHRRVVVHSWLVVVVHIRVLVLVLAVGGSTLFRLSLQLILLGTPHMCCMVRRTDPVSKLVVYFQRKMFVQYLV